MVVSRLEVAKGFAKHHQHGARRCGREKSVASAPDGAAKDEDKALNRESDKDKKRRFPPFDSDRDRGGGRLKRRRAAEILEVGTSNLYVPTPFPNHGVSAMARLASASDSAEEVANPSIAPESGLCNRGTMMAAAIPAEFANGATASPDLNARRRTITTKSIATNPTAVAAWTPPGAMLFIAASATVSPQKPSASRILRGVGNESTLSRRLKNRSSTRMMIAPLAIAASADMATKGAAALPADGITPANMTFRHFHA